MSELYSAVARSQVKPGQGVLGTHMVVRISSIICQRRSDLVGSKGSSCRYAFEIAHGSYLPVRFRDADFWGFD